jgi:hypothetical protein
VQGPFDATIEKVVAALKEEGFGVLTDRSTFAAIYGGKIPRCPKHGSTNTTPDAYF